MAERSHTARTLVLLTCLSGAAAWRPVLQLGSQWPAWKLLIDDAATSGTSDGQSQPAQQDYTPEAEKDFVAKLPGFGRNGKLPFGLYAGWVVMATTERWLNSIRLTRQSLLSMASDRFRIAMPQILHR